MDRNTLAQSLVGVPVQDLLAVLPNNTLRHVATQLHPNGPPAHEVASGSQDTSVVRAKRPLNAFMAFRKAYYLKMFPDIQQKTVSGFLTTLWNKEAQRNKWALIAKVYSFVRDHLGKGKVNLAAFLALCCPIMRMIDPADYLDTLGWVVQENPEGAMAITQVQDDEHSVESTSAPDAYPTSEIELLASLIESGYLPEHGPGLIQLMSQNNNGIMTLSVDKVDKKKEFIDSLVKDPYQATEQILGAVYDHAYFQRMSIYSWETLDLGDFSHIPITIPYPPTNEPYPFHDDNRPGVPTSMPFDAHLTPAQRAYEKRLNEVAGAWDMDDSYVAGYIAEISPNYGVSDELQ
ncbi:hypothetical protein NW755_010297 [Fusarium falciforme]|uniref:Alpha box domain-containing protein n=1 Tax=Fusarium falciforme TaxID=195108 RepID=A0A9W8R1T7_9HYPO|nr:hypothetical protein NW755_010297 [Fusarium falciforme]KAJ4244706.1 hypothetical protein NW757_010446 [Fusarium falciforme]